MLHFTSLFEDEDGNPHFHCPECGQLGIFVEETIDTLELTSFACQNCGSYLTIENSQVYLHHQLFAEEVGRDG